MTIKTYFKSKSIYEKAKLSQKKDNFGYKEIESQFTETIKDEDEEYKENEEDRDRINLMNNNGDVSFSTIQRGDTSFNRNKPDRIFNEKKNSNLKESKSEYFMFRNSKQGNLLI